MSSGHLEVCYDKESPRYGHLTACALRHMMLLHMTKHTDQRARTQAPGNSLSRQVLPQPWMWVVQLLLRNYMQQRWSPGRHAFWWRCWKILPEDQLHPEDASLKWGTGCISRGQFISGSSNMMPVRTAVASLDRRDC